MDIKISRDELMGFASEQALVDHFSKVTGFRLFSVVFRREWETRKTMKLKGALGDLFLIIVDTTKGGN